MIIEAAIFPIPDLVALPGSALQLHVFEPRYRRMVVECVERGRALAVAFGSRHKPAVGKAPKPQTLSEILSSNQETYVPAQVFGVGDVGVLARLPDGRFLVEVSVRHRARLVQYVQEVPYLIANVDILPPDPAGDPASRRLFEGLLLASDALLGDKAKIFRSQLGDGVVDSRRLDRLVYPILQWFQVGATATQALLEEETDYERGARLLAWMIRYLEVARGKTELEAEDLMPQGDDDDENGEDDDGEDDDGREDVSAPRRGGDGGGKLLPFRRPRRGLEHRPRP